MKQLVEEREANGLFTSFQDFCERMYDRELNRRALESLIKAGSFDSMHYYRSQLLKIVNPVVDAIAQNRKKNIEGQMDLFGMGNDEVRDTQIAMPNIPEVPKRELLAMEKGDHRSVPLRSPDGRVPQPDAEGAGGLRQADHRRPDGRNGRPVYKDGMTVRLACVITAVRLKSTRNGSMMAYVTAEDDTAAISN